MVQFNVNLETVSPHDSLWRHFGDGATTWFNLTSLWRRCHHMVQFDVILETVSPHGSIWRHVGDGVTTWLYFTSLLVAGKVVVWTRLVGQKFHFSLDTNCSWYDEDCKLTSNHEEQPRRFVVSHSHPVLYSLSYTYEYRILIDFIPKVSATHKLGNRRTQPIHSPMVLRKFRPRSSSPWENGGVADVFELSAKRPVLLTHEVSGSFADNVKKHRWNFWILVTKTGLH